MGFSSEGLVGVAFDRVSGFAGALARLGWRGVFSDQVQFASIQEFPLDLFSRFQADGRGQRDGKIDVELGLLPFGADGLHF